MFQADKIKVGIAPINWSNDDLPELGGEITFEQCIQEMAEAGYQGCEVGHKFPREVNALKGALAPYHLQIASAWFSSFFSHKDKMQDSLSAFKVHAEFLYNMAAKVVVVAECNHCIQQTDSTIFGQKPVLNKEGWELLVEGLHEAGRIAKHLGLKIVYHYHMGTVVQDQLEVDILMQRTDPELVSLVLDTGHLHFAGGDNLKLIKNHGHRIKHVHLKDIRADILSQTKIQAMSFLEAVKAGVFTVPGDGCINFKSIFRALCEVGYSGWFLVEAEQDPYKANPIEYAKMGRHTIKTLAGV